MIILAIRLLIITPFPSSNQKILLWFSLVILVLLVIASQVSALRPPTEISSSLIRIGLIAILALGGILRFYWVIYHPTPPTGDFLEYHKIASMFSAGIFQSTYSRPLGYPAILAITYLLRPDPISGRLLNVLLGVLTIYLVYQICMKAGGQGAALCGALIMAIFPTSILMSSILCTEIGAAAFFTGTIFLLIDAMSKESKMPWIAGAGFSFGMGLLFRTALIFHLPWMLVTVWWISAGPKKQKLGLITTFLSTMMFMPVALLAWHSFASGNFSMAPFENRVGSYMLLSGTNWTTRGQFSLDDANLYATWSEETRSRKAIEVAWQRISDRPLFFPILVAAKMSNLFADSRYGTFWAFYSLPEEDLGIMNNWKNTFYVLEQSVYIIVLSLGWSLLWKMRRSFAPLPMILLISSIATAIPHIIIESQARYHDSLIPLICALAGVGAWQLIEGRINFRVKYF